MPWLVGGLMGCGWRVKRMIGRENARALFGLWGFKDEHAREGVRGHSGYSRVDVVLLRTYL